ncbi:ankyrin, partial [Thozetella sp. PMI_491]
HVETTNQYRHMPLAKAASYGNEPVVELLLDQGAKIGAPDNNGWTAVIRASLMGNRATVRLLLDRWAKIEASDEEGSTPLQWATYNGHDDAVKLLIDRGPIKYDETYIHGLYCAAV